MRVPACLTATLAVVSLGSLPAQGVGAHPSDHSPERLTELPELWLGRLGRLRTLTTHEVEGYPWSVGGETMDRGYTVYEHWKEYVEPLGVTQVRLQSGWARTERTRGTYEFAWLDVIVRDLVRRGVKPWISLSYGNPLYRGGGGAGLGEALPTSGESLAAWRKYVRAVVGRYADVVDTWEIWNEPNNLTYGSGDGPAEYGELLILTSEAIREIQPDATIIGFASAGHAVEWTAKTLRYLRDRDALDAIDLVSYHPYRLNPDDADAATERLRDSVARYAPDLRLYQGENGAPSEYRETKALRGHAWSERSQAKWVLRRALADRGRGIGTSIFSIADMRYPDEVNRKGLLLTDGDGRVVRPKEAYHAVRHLASTFGVDVVAEPAFRFRAETYHELKAYGFRSPSGSLVALWYGGTIPSDHDDPTATNVRFEGVRFDDPVYVDLRTGVVYELPASVWLGEGAFAGLPVYDSPVLIAERGAIRME